MGASGPPVIAELGMYPFRSVRWAWDALWTAVVDRLPWLPPRLAHSGDVHARWADPACLVNHVCGWPLAARHATDHRVVGAFSLTIPEADGHHYRSTIMATDPTPLSELDPATRHAAINHDDSLSGCVSLLAAAGTGPTWPGPTTVTGAHIESLRALQRGDVDLACIDSWSLRLIECEQPDLVAGLHPIGLGPSIPTPAITIRSDVDEVKAEAVGQALYDAVAGASAADVRAALLIDSFVGASIDEYLPVLQLVSDKR